VYRDLLATYLVPRRGPIALLAALVLGNVGLQLAGPLITRRFVDAATAGREIATLTGIALLYVAVAAVTQAGSVLETYLAETVAWTATNALRADLARHCLRLDMSFHTAHTPGELIERVDGDVAQLANFFSRFLLRVAASGLLLTGALVVLVQVDWRLSK
jgi:ABC-type multidrug transport system fused ATPase/permease subunit